MGIDTKAILRKGTTLSEIKCRLELKYGKVTVHPTHSDDFFNLSFKEPKKIPDASNYRTLAVFLNKYAKIDYKIDGVLISLGYWGSNIEIMKWLLEEFGGYLDENDCDDEGFYPVNIKSFKKGKDFSPKDLFINKVINKLGYDKLEEAMKLFEEYKEL